MKTEFQIAAETVVAEMERRDGAFSLSLSGREVKGEVLRWEPPFFTIRHCDHILQGAFYRGGDFVDVHLPKGNYRVRFAGKKRSAKGGHAAGGLSSPMPGKVIQILVKDGDAVKKGDLLMMLEAMKMEHKILSPADGIVKQVFFREGERVAQDVELLEIAPEANK